MALYTVEQLERLKASGKMKPEKITDYYVEEDGVRRYLVLEGERGFPAGRVKYPDRHERNTTVKKRVYSDKKKIEAATLHVALGNLVKVHQITKIPVYTLRGWVDQDWWLQIQQRVRREANEETDSKFSKVIDKALNKLEKAIENGDYIYDIKRGEVVPVPMSGRDLSIVAGTIFDKRQLLRGEATKIEKNVNSEQHLRDLAAKFAAMVDNKMKIVSTQDGVNNASTDHQEQGRLVSSGDTERDTREIDQPSTRASSATPTERG